MNMSHLDVNFPMRSVPQLVKCFSEMGVEIQASQIENPTTESFQLILIQCMSRLFGIVVEQFLESRDSPLYESEFVHPQLHKTSRHTSLFLILMKRFYEALSLSTEKLSLIRILLRPTQRDVILLGSAIVNFEKFRTDLRSRYEDLEQQVRETTSEEEATRRKLENAERAHQHVVRAEERRRQQVLQERSELDRLRDSELVQLRDSVTEATSQHQANIEEIRRLRERVTTARSDLARKTSLASTLRANLKDPPEELARRNDQLRSELKQLTEKELPPIMAEITQMEEYTEGATRFQDVFGSLETRIAQVEQLRKRVDLMRARRRQGELEARFVSVEEERRRIQEEETMGREGHLQTLEGLFVQLEALRDAVLRFEEGLSRSTRPLDESQ